MAQIADERPIAGDIAAATGEGLAERPHHDVDVAGGEAEMLGDAAPGAPEDAEGMRLVDHQHEPVAALRLDGARRRENIAVHAVDALGDEEAAPCRRAQLREEPVERCPILVPEAENLRL